ncbi:MAG: hypothetical protein MI923_20595 [Phycisphaerales bacterium]|nr:hypothetical protein [Phycisphaerales bacterium]
MTPRCRFEILDYEKEAIPNPRRGTQVAQSFSPQATSPNRAPGLDLSGA